MNKYDYAMKALKDYHKKMMELSQKIIDVWNDEDPMDMAVRSNITQLQCEMESFYSVLESNIRGDEHDELADMIEQFYGQIAAMKGGE